MDRHDKHRLKSDIAIIKKSTALSVSMINRFSYSVRFNREYLILASGI